MGCTEDKNPLKRFGTSQGQRLLDAMKADYVRVEERGYANWVVFASRFSEYLHFYSNADEIQGNWKPFFENDLSAILGTIAIQNIDDYRESIKRRFDILRSEDYLLKEKKKALSGLFSGVFTFCKALDSYLLKLPESSSFKIQLRNTILLKLQPALKKLLAYYKGAQHSNLLKDQQLGNWQIFYQPVETMPVLISEGLSSIWTGTFSNWTSFYASINEDKSVYGDAAWQPLRRLNQAGNHNLFSGLFDQFLLSYARIIRDAEQGLLETLGNFNSHEPHYALFLSFLKLFRYASDHANTITQRHLDFYYKDVLRLEQKQASPNKVHLVVELAKHVTEHFLSKGTLFKAGKDSLGKEVLYSLENDAVFNKTQATRFLSLYRGSSFDNYGSVNNNKRLFASPAANSADGLGAEIKTELKEWHPFVSKTFKDGALEDVNMPLARIGFAVAAANLYLTEGERLVRLKIKPALNDDQLAAFSAVETFLTTEEGWYLVNASSQSWSNQTIASETASVFTFSLPGDAPAIVNYQQKVHQGSFNTPLPILKLLLVNDLSGEYRYQKLKDLSITTLELEVKVGLDAGDNAVAGGLKNLVLSNDVGVLDPSKPFLPFGPVPLAGYSLIAGNEELFKKKNAAVKFSLRWKNLPGDIATIDYDTNASDATPPQLEPFLLENGEWADLGSDVFTIFTASGSVPNAQVTFPDDFAAIPSDAVFPYADVYPAFNISSKKGFLKLSLTSGFGIREYQKQLTLYLIGQAKTPPEGTEPPEPYVPLIESLTLHYKASVSLTLTDEANFETRDLRFFHIYPFGEKEEHKAIDGSVTVPLLPQLKTAGSENVAELYVGLEGWLPGQGLNVLFQVLEGSNDPLLDKPEKHITWSYLQANSWKVFTPGQFADNTSQLLQSGIISFTIPDNASTDNTLMPAGYLWLKASVSENAEAVCKLLSVQTQAVVAVFQDNQNASDFLDKSLPAGSISKLKQAVSAVKKITQPYSSFGGKKKESEAHFYLRVSERLRHKSRAITIWDFEHLVLEAFPAIHKVKCLNHTKFEGTEYNEVAPGCVTIITIPDLENRNDTNPLRPYTNQSVLVQIEAFLRRKLSCHVKLNVRHPQFEEVKLQFDLKVADDEKFNYYHDLLQQEITGFLTPWAFAESSDIDFGGEVHKSVLINFIEERSYVLYIKNVQMFHRIDEAGGDGLDTDYITASTAKSILVSVPAVKHVINKITINAEEPEEVKCADQYNLLT